MAGTQVKQLFQRNQIKPNLLSFTISLALSNKEKIIYFPNLSFDLDQMNRRIKKIPDKVSQTKLSHQEIISKYLFSAFVLPIVQALRGRIVPRVRALVILPVQELAAQVFKVFQNYCEGSGLKVRLISGQKSFANEQTELVRKGSVGTFHSLADILVI